MLETLTRATFAEYQNEKFQLQADGIDSFDVELIEVGALIRYEPSPSPTGSLAPPMISASGS